MKYYDEVTKRLYDTEKEALAAAAAREKELAEAEERKERLASERKARAEEVEAAYKDMLEAKENYNKLLSDFVKDYKSYHFTFHDGDSFFDHFFKIW